MFAQRNLDVPRDWQAVGSVWSGNFDCPAELKATRKPGLFFGFDGLFLFRFAARQFLAELFQLPPRFTRFEPNAIRGVRHPEVPGVGRPPE